MACVFIVVGLVCIVVGVILLFTQPSVLDSQKASTHDEQITSLNSTYVDEHTTSSLSADNSSSEKRVLMGRQFEEWVVCKFPKENYTIKEWRGDKYIDGIYAESSRYPDLEIELKINENYREIFAVECKYLSHLNASIEWTSSEKLAIYNKYAEDTKHPVFILFGIGGTPSSPKEVYVVPLQSLQTTTLTIGFLRTCHRHDLSRTLYYYGKEKRLL